MHVAFRPGTAADASRGANLWLRARTAAVGAMPPPAHDAEDVHRWFASHVVRDTEWWVAEDRSRRPLGIMVLDGSWLDQLYVEPAMTGRGIGGRLVEIAKRRRPDGLRLWTFASNPRAGRFYERHGFVEVRRTDGAENEEHAPDILYVWPR